MDQLGLRASSSSDSEEICGLNDCPEKFSGVVSEVDCSYFLRRVCSFKEIYKISDEVAFFTFATLLQGQSKFWWMAIKDSLRDWTHLTTEFTKAFYAPKTYRKMFLEAFSLRNRKKMKSQQRYEKLEIITGRLASATMDELRTALFLLVFPDKIVNEIPNVDNIPFSEIGTEMWKVEKRLKLGPLIRSDVTIPPHWRVPASFSSATRCPEFSFHSLKHVKFHGEGTEVDALWFLTLVDDFKKSLRIPDDLALGTIDYLFKKVAREWWSFTRMEVNNWEEFNKKFKERFIFSTLLYCNISVIMDQIENKQNTTSLQRYCEFKHLTQNFETCSHDDLKSALFIAISPRELVKNLPIDFVDGNVPIYDIKNRMIDCEKYK